MSMETVLVLSELETAEASESLLRVARQKDRPGELRAAAIWGLSQSPMHGPSVVEFLGEDDEIVAIHALVGATDSLADGQLHALAEALDGSDRQSAAAASILYRRGAAGAGQLMRVLDDGPERARSWALWA